jgi:hypothetical protein
MMDGGKAEAMSRMRAPTDWERRLIVMGEIPSRFKAAVPKADLLSRRGKQKKTPYSLGGKQGAKKSGHSPGFYRVE